MALSAPFVTNSGSPCKNVAAAMDVLCTCLCWVTSCRRSRSQNAMWPWGLPDAKIGGPSIKERERDTHAETTCIENSETECYRYETATCTCSEGKRADWSPVLFETHQRLVQSDVVNNDGTCCRADTNNIYSRTLENKTTNEKTWKQKLSINNKIINK